ncbi:MAG: hypothetical protein IKC13_03400 [Elusimicrobiaceae bacterium]|nr:hypothetical protein [Elusimicrobiaceae bacterium]
MKKLILCAAFLFPFHLNAQNTMQKADEAFAKADFTAALELYQTEAKTATGADLYKAQLRSIACQNHLGQYVTAAKTAFSYPLPKDALWKARFLLYRYQTAQDAYDQSIQFYGYEDTDVASATNEDLINWQEKALQSLQEVWKMQDTLLQAPIEEQDIIISVTKDTDTEMIPTLYDFVVWEWLVRFQSKNATPLPAETAWNGRFKATQNPDNEPAFILSVLDQAAKKGGKNRADARLIWQVRKITLPFEYPQFFSFKDKRTEMWIAAQVLTNLIGFKKEDVSWWKRIKSALMPTKNISPSSADPSFDTKLLSQAQDYSAVLQAYQRTQESLPKVPFGKSFAAYFAAKLAEDVQEFQFAVQICQWAQENFPQNFYTSKCQQLAQEITKPVLNRPYDFQVGNPKDIKLLLDVRNIHKIYVRVYPVTQEQLKKDNTKETYLDSWFYLKTLQPQMLDSLRQQKPLFSTQQDISYKKPHILQAEDIKIPFLPEPGFYAVFLSDKEDFSKDSNTLGMLLNRTDLALLYSTNIAMQPAQALSDKNISAETERVYVLNFKTGQPEPQAQAQYIPDAEHNPKHILEHKTESLVSDDQGVLSFKNTFNPTSHFNNQMHLRVDKNGSTSFVSYNYRQYTPPVLEKLYIETDRAIYRPGQKVNFAVYGFQNTARGFQPMPKNKSVNIEIRDTNWEVVYEKTLSLNDFGTAQDSYTLPQTDGLGSWRISVETQNYQSTQSYFKVEEYKRPDYKITLNPAVLQKNKEAAIEGKAQYYFGAPLAGAQVSYKVTRSYFSPRFCWWWPIIDDEKVLWKEGTATTGKDGSFHIHFTPETDKDLPAIFSVEVSVKDESGREIEESKDYRISTKPAFFSVKWNQNFYDAQTETDLVHVGLVDVNGQPLKGKIDYAIYELENVLSSDSYAKNKVLRKVLQQTLVVDQNTPAITLPALPEGIYKLTLSNKQAQKEEFVFLVVQEKTNLALAEVNIPQHDTYYPGDEAKILIGAQALKGPKWLEISQGQFLLKKELLPAGAQIYTLPIAKDTLPGSIGTSWLGFTDYQAYGAITQIQILPKAQKLTLDIAVPPSVKPGEKVSWNAQIKDYLGQAVNGQISLRVYDKSLDYYTEQQGFDFSYLLTNSVLDKTSEFYPISNTSKINWISSNILPVTGPKSYNPLPQINLNGDISRYDTDRALGLNSARYARAGVLDSVKAPRAALTKAANTEVAEDAFFATEYGSFAEESSAVRTNFAETAYFNAIIPAKQGKADVQFTMPDQLTTWNIMALALTKNAAQGTFNAQTITQKDLMVRLSLPRFWREHDQSTLVVQVSNITDQARDAQVTLDLRVNGKDVAADFGITPKTKKVHVPAHSNTALTWPISIPDGVGVLDISATLRSGKESDAEAHQLPLLPAAERLAESTTAALENNAQTLALQNLLTPDDTRRVSVVNFRLDPGLLMSVFQAMPQLVKPYYKDAASLINRYVPLAVINNLYQEYPALRQAVGKLDKNPDNANSWSDNQDPARLLLLEETPWLRQARNSQEEERFLTDIFNPSAVQKTYTQVQKDLQKYQTSSGGYSWLPGGKASPYITLNVLSGFADALRYGGEIPQKSAQKALAYLAPEIEKDLKESTPSAYVVAHALYAAYVFSAFPQEWKEVQQAPIQKWLDYAALHRGMMTALGQTYAAAAYFRLGDEKKAAEFLDLVLSRMKTDPVTGAYFAPEAQSWLWYQDTISTQATTLRTLLEIRPQATQQAAQMVKWLMFNRKAQAWDNTLNTAQALYALLDYMRKYGLMNKPARYSLAWGDMQKDISFKPWDFSQQLRWTQEAENVAPSYYTAKVSQKDGLTGFATLDAVYTTHDAKASPKGVLNVSRQYMLKYTENGTEKLRKLAPEEKIPVGAEVEVVLTLQTDSAFDFVVLTDPKPAGFENDDLLSGWAWEGLSRYQEYRDSATRFFFDYVPTGRYTLTYTLRPTLAGQYHSLPAQVQSMYAPEFSAHTASDILNVK